MDVVIEIPARFTTAEWTRDLRRRYRLHEEPSIKATTRFFDTFDGRLFEKGLACSSSAGIVRLHPVDDPGGGTQVAIEPPPRFASDYPPGRLKEWLLPVAGQRALLEVLALSTVGQGWRILNVDQKTVARIALEEAQVRDETRSAHLGPFLILRPVRGYERLTREIEEWFHERGLHSGRPVYLQALDALHRTPKRSVPEPGMKVTASMPAADAVRSMLGSLYQIVRANEPQVVADTDVEFLHDYRVAIRKARSLVGQTKGVFAPGPTARFRKSLSWLGRSTNCLRDLDVALLCRSKYQNLLGSPLGAQIEPLFASLEDERQREFEALSNVMNSSEHADALFGWGRLVEDPALLGLGRKATVSIEKLARDRIAKKLRRVLEQGYELTGGTEPGALHTLRIECKELRYIMDLFADLVPEAKRGVRRMKKLQDNLGAIQDLTVQEERLQRYLTAAASSNEDADTPRAINHLIAGLCEERRSEQGRVLKLFARFSACLEETDPPYTLLLPWLRLNPGR